MVEDLNDVESIDNIGIEGPMMELTCEVEFGEEYPIPHGIETSASGDYTNGFSTIHLLFGELDEKGNYTDSHGFNVSMSIECAEHLRTNLTYLLDRVKEENENASDVA